MNPAMSNPEATQTGSRPSPWRERGPVLLAAALLLAGAFAWGRVTATPQPLYAQGRAPTSPVQPPVSGGPGVPSADPTETAVVPMDGGGAAAANGFLAVSGSYGIGTSVLYLVDTNSRQMAVYEARGGAAGMRRLVLVGARRIDLDLQLEEYNDKSEYSHSDLQQLFDRRNRRANEAAAKDPGGNGR